MSFGGSVSGMIASLKNNARSKRKGYFDKKDSSKYNISTNKLLEKKASLRQLKNIKEKLEIENKKDRIIFLKSENYIFKIKFRKIRILSFD